MGSLLGTKKILDAPDTLFAPSEGMWWPGRSAADSLQHSLNVPRFFRHLPMIVTSCPKAHASGMDISALPAFVAERLKARGRVRSIEHVAGPPFSGYFLELAIEIVSRDDEEYLRTRLTLKLPEIFLERYEAILPSDSLSNDTLAITIDEHLAIPFSRRLDEDNQDGIADLASFHDAALSAALSDGLSGVRHTGIKAASIAYRSDEEARKTIWPKVYDALLFSGDIEAATIVAHLDEILAGRERRHLGCHLARHFGHKLPALLLCAGALEALEDHALKQIEWLIYPAGTPVTREKQSILTGHFGSGMATLREAGHHLANPKVFKTNEPSAILHTLRWSLPLWTLWYGPKIWPALQKLSGDVKSLRRELRRLLSGLLAWFKKEPLKQAPTPPPMQAKLTAIQANDKLRLFDAYNEDSTCRQLRGYLQSGDWSEVKRLLDELQDWEERDFYTYSLSRSKERPDWLDKWAEARPGDPSIWLLRGNHSVYWAWEARGPGDEDELTEERRRPFLKRLKQAQDELVRAAELDPADPCPFSTLLKVATGLRLAQQDVLTVFQELVRRDPEHFWGHRHMLVYLFERHQGSHELMFRFVRDISKTRPQGSDLHGLVVEAHIERAAVDGMAAGYFLKSEVKEEIMLAYRQSLLSNYYRETRNTARMSNAFALAFFYSRQKEPLERELLRMRGRVTKAPWCHFGNSMVVAKHAVHFSRGGEKT
jgi:hypothetical protein